MGKGESTGYSLKLVRFVRSVRIVQSCRQAVFAYSGLRPGYKPHPGKCLVLPVLLFALIFSACEDGEEQLVQALDAYGRLVELHIQQRQRPGRTEPNRELARYLDKKLGEIINILDAVYEFRLQEPGRFEELFQVYRSRIVAVLQKLSLINRQERQLLHYFSLIFSSGERYRDRQEMQRMRDLFLCYYRFLQRLTAERGGLD